jgi:SAM-dependent methyltransferase
MNTPVYEKTRQAWRDIWLATDFERELATLAYPRAQELLNAYLPYLDKAAPILEAGCGPGHVVYYLRERGYNALGVDYAPEALKPTLAHYPSIPLHAADVHALPYPSGYFGAYLSFGVVEHFEQGPMAALAEAFRVLRHGGTLILTTPHPNFVEDLVKLANRLSPARVKNRPPRAEYYETQYSHRQLTQFAQDAGFQVTRLVPYGHSYTFYGLGGPFRKPGYYQSSALGEFAGKVGRRVFPWYTAFECLVIARKP